MARRGKILRDTSSGPGLLVVEGTQYPFTLEGAWKGEVPPKVGMTVDVEIGAGGEVFAVHPVAEGVLAKEQADQAMQALKDKGGAVAGAMVARFGARDLIALAALVLGWFFLKAGSFGGGIIGKVSFTFWQVLGFLNSGAQGMLERAAGGSAGTGLWGIVAVLALAAPFAHHFWKDKKAHLGGLLPLLLMLFVLWRVNSGMGDAGGGSTSMFGEDGAQMAEEFRREMRAAVSLGLGFYVSIAAAIYFAVTSVRRWLVA